MQTTGVLGELVTLTSAYKHYTLRTLRYSLLCIKQPNTPFNGSIKININW